MEKVYKVSHEEGEVEYVTEKFFSPIRGYDREDIKAIKDLRRGDSIRPDPFQVVELILEEADIVTDGKGNKAIFREPIFEVRSAGSTHNMIIVDVFERNGTKVDEEKEEWDIEGTEVLGDSTVSPEEDFDISELSSDFAAELELESEQELKEHGETLEKLQEQEITVEEAAHEIAEAHHKINNPDYRYYVINSENKIVSGWEYKEDAREFKKEQDVFGDGKLVVVNKKQLKDMGKDPDDNSSWDTKNKPSDKDILWRAVNWYEHEIEHKVIKKVEGAGLQNQIDVNYIKDKVKLAESNIETLSDTLKKWVGQLLDMYSIGILDIATNANKLGLSKTSSELMAEYKSVTEYRNKLD